MPKVLVIGMSGTGKSTALRLLSLRGHRTEDTDSDRCSPNTLTAAFSWGAASPIRASSIQFDHIALLSTPASVLRARVADRSDNPYLKRPDERGLIGEQQQSLISTLLPRSTWGPLNLIARNRVSLGELRGVQETTPQGLPRLRMSWAPRLLALASIQAHWIAYREHLALTPTLVCLPNLTIDTRRSPEPFAWTPSARTGDASLHWRCVVLPAAEAARGESVSL